MAAANLDTNKLSGEFNNIKAITFTALDGTDGGEYTVKTGNERIVVLIQNTDDTNAETVTIKSPAHPALGTGTAFADKAVSVAKSAFAAAYVESMRYMDATTGKIKITGSADVNVAILEI